MENNWSIDPTKVAVSGAVGLAVAYTATKLMQERRTTYRKQVQDPDTLIKVPKGTRRWTVDPDGTVEPILAKKGLGSLAPTTVMQVFKAAVARQGSSDALAVERNGAWVKYSWQQYYNNVMEVARAFVHLGLEPFGCVNIIGFNSPEWFFAALAATAVGAKAAGIYTTNGAEACHYVTEHSEASIVVVEDITNLKKFLSIANRLPKLKALVMWTGEVPTDLVQSAKVSVPVLSWQGLLDLRTRVDQSVIDNLIEKQKPSQCCLLIYTSGTTAAPKAVMISHDNLTWTAAMTFATLPGTGKVAERMVSYLPLSHVAAQMLDIHGPMYAAATFAQPMTIFFARPDALKGSLGDTLKVVRPTMFFGVPRVWEKIQEKMKAVGASTTGLLKVISTWAKDLGMEHFVANQAGGSGISPPLYFLAKAVVLDKVRGALGLDQCRFCFSGAAPISADTINYFGQLGIVIHQVYGMSECTGPATLEADGAQRVGSVGPALPGVEVKLDHDPNRDKPGEGEICYRGRNIMMGYMKGEAKTRESIDEDGFLHSGDVGRFDEWGLLHITGRIKELIITAGGENIAPVPIEDTIKELCPGLSNVMLVGDRRKYNIALVTLKTKQVLETGAFTGELVGDAVGVSSESKTVADAKKDPVWQKYIESAIKKYNSSAVSNAQNVQKFVILDEDFSVPTGELTGTMKLKREFVTTKYQEIIDKTYAD